MAFDPEFEKWKQTQNIQDVLGRAKQFNQFQSDQSFGDISDYGAPLLDKSQMPFLEDSPYTTNQTQFDPYSVWRDHTANRDLSSIGLSDPVSVNDPSYDTTTIPGIPQNFNVDATDPITTESTEIEATSDPFTVDTVDDRQSISLKDAEEQKWLDEWHPFDPEWRKAKDKWTPIQDARQEMAELRGYDSWEAYQEGKALEDQKYEEKYGRTRAEYHQYDPETFESTDPEVIAQEEEAMWDEIDADNLAERNAQLMELYGTTDPDEIRNLIDPEVIEQRTQEALAAGYGSLEEYDEAMGQWKPFDPQWRRAKGKGTPIQDRKDQREEDAMWEEIDADNQAKSDAQLMDQYGTTDPDEIKKAMHKEMYGELGKYQYVDQGGNLQENIPPDRPTIPVDSEDETWDEDITMEDTEPEEYDEWRAYDPDLENEMKTYGKWDDSKDYSENILAYEDWQEGYHPFDKDWRRSKGKHIFDKDARIHDQETKARLGGMSTIRDEQYNLQQTQDENIKIRESNTELANKAKTDLETNISDLETQIKNNMSSGALATDSNGNVIQDANGHSMLLVDKLKDDLKNAQSSLDNFDPKNVSGLQKEVDLPGVSKMEDIEGTKEYKAKQKELDIDLGKGYHPDDEEWRRSKDKSLYMDMDDNGNPTDESPWRNEYQKKEISNISSDWQNKDFWNDANGDGIVDNDELDTSKMSAKERKRWSKFNDADEKRFSKREKKHRKEHGGYDEDGEWQDKDYWKKLYMQKGWDERWRPFDHDWRKEHDKFTLKPKTRDDFDTDEEFTKYKKDRANKMDRWAEIFKGAPGEFGGLSAMFFAAAGANPYEYKNYFRDDKEK